jgi:hypothetical protein
MAAVQVHLRNLTGKGLIWGIFEITNVKIEQSTRVRQHRNQVGLILF